MKIHENIKMCEVERAPYHPIVWIRWISSLLGSLLISELCHLFHQSNEDCFPTEVWLGKIWHFQTEQESDELVWAFWASSPRGWRRWASCRGRGMVKEAWMTVDQTRMPSRCLSVKFPDRWMKWGCFHINLFSPPFCSLSLPFSMYLFSRRSFGNSSANLVLFTN